MSKFKVSLCSPYPRKGFGPGDIHVDNELDIMRSVIDAADGDIVVFPEAFLDEFHLNEAAEIAAKSGKWIVSGARGCLKCRDQIVILISPDQGVVYSHTKTSLTEGDRAYGSSVGTSIEAVDTPFCRIGTVLCYEIHFPEVSRILALDGAELLINTVGTGMWHEQQFYEWTTVAKCRAIENRCFVVGCTHYCDPIPMIFAYDPHGRELLLKRDQHGPFTVEIDTDLIDEKDFLRDRTPACYGKISETGSNAQ